MHWSQVSSSYTRYIKLVGRKKLNIHYAVCMIDNNPKYYSAKRGDTDGFHEYNPYYEWNKLSHEILIQLPNVKIKEASLHKNKETLLNDDGYRMYSNDKKV